MRNANKKMISKEASRYATKLTLRESKAKTAGEAQKEYSDLIEEKPHQFSLENKVTTLEQAAQRANYFSEVDGGYPAGMSVCYTVGISGDCGFSCPDFQNGICEVGEEMLLKLPSDHIDEEYSLEEIEEFKDLYGMLE